MNRPPHIDWFEKSSESLKTVDGKDIEIWDFFYQQDDEMLSQWAKHFRNHYCLDSEINKRRGKLTSTDFLENYKFPSASTKLGHGIRAGDFAEILVADFIEWLMNYWVPRIRWMSKSVRDESPKGCDIIGFKYLNHDFKPSNKDQLVVYESKAKFSKSKINRMQDAVNGSAKDQIRLDESLNYIKQKLLDSHEDQQAMKVERFQNPVDIQYQQIYGAVVVISEEFYKAEEMTSTDCRRTPDPHRKNEFIKHPNRDKLHLVVIKGKSFMNLVNELYKRAADEA
jgi:hypothetical protein